MDELWLKAAGASGATVLALVVMGLIRGTIVAGWLYREAKEEGAEYKRLFLESLKVAARSAEVVQSSVEVARLATNTTAAAISTTPPKGQPAP